MELTTYQQLYLQTIYDYFHENGDWPFYEFVEKKIIPKHPNFDVLEIANSFINGSSRDDFVHHIGQQAILSIEQISLCKGSEKDLADFLLVLKYCFKKFINSERPGVHISGDQVIHDMNMEELDVSKVGLLIADSYIYDGWESNFDGGQYWDIFLSDDIAYFGNVQTIDDYIVKCETYEREHNINKLNKSLKSSIIDPAPFIEKVAKTDPANIQETTANLMQIDNSYYMNALLQSHRSFFWALISTGVGVAFFIAAVFILIFRQLISQSYVAAIITASSGGVVEIIAGIILVLHQRASVQANQCHERLNRLQRFLVAMSHCETLEGDLKQTTRAKLMEKLND